MVRETDLSDAAFGFARGDPLFDAVRLQALPLGDIREHVHQVVIDMVCAKARKLLIEGLVDRLYRPHQVLRQLCRNVDLVTNFVFFKYPSEAFLTARICVSGIEVVYTLFYCTHDLTLGLLIVDLCALACEPHAAVSQLRQLIPVFIFSVSHFCISPLCIC